MKATISALATPRVVSGHVAAWIGVGGYGVGPNGTDEWLQVGLVAYEDGVTRLYYEVTRPGRWPRYVEVDSYVARGERRRLAVVEMFRRPNWWRVWVGRRAVTRPIHLPRSHGAWAPMATAESWNGGEGACNAFAFRLSRVAIATRPARWRGVRVRGAWLMQDPGYRVGRWSGTIIAAVRRWPVDPVTEGDPVDEAEDPLPDPGDSTETTVDPTTTADPNPAPSEPDPGTGI